MPSMFEQSIKPRFQTCAEVRKRRDRRRINGATLTRIVR